MDQPALGSGSGGADDFSRAAHDSQSSVRLGGAPVNATEIAEWWVSSPRCHPDLLPSANGMPNGGSKGSRVASPSSCSRQAKKLARLEKAADNLASIVLEDTVRTDAIHLCFYRWRTEALSMRNGPRLPAFTEHVGPWQSSNEVVAKQFSNEVVAKQKERRAFTISRLLQSQEDIHFSRVCLLRWHHMVFQDASARWKALVQGGLQGGLSEFMESTTRAEAAARAQGEASLSARLQPELGDRLADAEAVALKAFRIAEVAEQRAEQAVAVAREMTLQAKCLDVGNHRAVGSMGATRGDRAVGRTKSAGTGGTGGRADGTGVDGGRDGSRGGTDENQEDFASLSMEANLVHAELRCLELRKQLEGAELEAARSRQELNRRIDPVPCSNRSTHPSARRSPSPLMRLGFSLEAPPRRTLPVTPHSMPQITKAGYSSATTPPRTSPEPKPPSAPTSTAVTSSSPPSRPVAVPAVPAGTWNAMGSVSTSSSARVRSPHTTSAMSPATPVVASPVQAFRKIDIPHDPMQAARHNSKKRAMSPMHSGASTSTSHSHGQLPTAPGMSARQGSEVGHCSSPPQPFPSKNNSLLLRSVLVRGPSSGSLPLKPSIGSPRFQHTTGSSTSSLPGSSMVPAGIPKGSASSPPRKSVTPTRSPPTMHSRDVQVPPWAAAQPTKMASPVTPIMPSQLSETPSVTQVAQSRQTMAQPKSVRSMLTNSNAAFLDSNVQLEGASPKSTFRINTDR